MKYKKSLVFICLLICLFSIASVVASDVNETDLKSAEEKDIGIGLNSINESDVFLNCANNDCNQLGETNSDGTFTDLVNDINTARKEFNLTKNYIYSTGDSKYKSGIEINKKITINGNGFFIDGANVASGFLIKYSGVVLNNISFKNCYSSSYGSAIYCSKDNCVLDYCSFLNCNSNSKSNHCYGGVVHWFGNGGILKNCIFNNCEGVSEYSSSFGLNSYGGTIYWHGSNGSLINCSFQNCFAKTSSTSNIESYAYGGAVYWASTTGSLINCNFNNCIASATSKCTDSANSKAYAYGGAIYWIGADGYINNSIFKYSNSKSSSSTVPNSQVTQVTNSISQASGGAIYYGGIRGIINNCQFFDCSSSSSASYSTQSYVTTSYSHSYGGSIYWKGKNGDLENCSFNRCSATASGRTNVISSGNTLCWEGEDGFLYNSSFNGDGNNLKDEVSVANKFNTKLNAKISEVIIREQVLLDVGIYPINLGNLSVYQYNESTNYILNNVYHIPVSNSTITLPIFNLTSGKYKFTVIYEGDDFYRNCSTEIFLEIHKVDSSIYTTNIENLNAGESTTLNVTLNDDATGNVSVFISNKEFIGDVINGVAKVYLCNLFGGNNEFLVRYNGDDKYKSCSIIKFSNLTFKQSFIKFNVSDNYYGEPIILSPITSDNLTGNISIFIDDIYEVDFPVMESHILNNINAGNHSITLRYNGNNYFSPCQNSTYFSIFKSNVNFTLNTSHSHAFDDISISLNFNKKVNGDIIFCIDNKNYSANVLNGESKLNISGLKKGNYNYTINYLGDNNSYPFISKSYLNISFKNLTMVCSINNVFFGEKSNLIYSLNNGTSGILSIYINNTFVNNISVGDIIEFHDLNVGTYLVKLVFHGNDYYDCSQATASFEVKKWDPIINISAFAGKNGTVNIILNNDATGNISMSVDNKLYLGTLTNGTITFKHLDLTKYRKNFVINYSGDLKYKSSYLSIIYSPKGISSYFTVNITDINYGESIFIKPNITEGATGSIYVSVDGGNSKSFNVGNSYNLTDLPVGRHRIFIQYMGDSYYDGYYKSYYFNVFKVNPSIYINSSTNNGYTTINVNINSTATGNVNFTINDDVYSATLNKGKYKFSTGRYFPGNYDLIINYSGDTNYNPISVNYTLNVSKWNLNIIQSNTVYAGNNSIITFNLQTSDVTGNATLNITDIMLTGTVINGKISFIIPTIKPGYKKYTFNFMGDSKYDSYVLNSRVNVRFQPPLIDFNLTNILYGDNITFTPVITLGALGNYEVLFDGSYIGNFSVGESFNHLILNGGNHNITLVYSGDEYFASKEVTKEFEVYRLNSTINITDKLEASKSAIINVTLNEDAMFGVSIIINSKKYSIDLVEGIATFNVPNLIAGNYDVVINYEGDTKYAPFTITKQVIVYHKESSIDLDIQNIYIGNNLVLNPIVDLDATGTKTIYLDNVLVSSIGVKSTYTLTNLKAGKYEVRVVYNGDSYYAPNEKTTVFRVLTIDPINVKDMQIVYGNNKKFQATFYDEYGNVLTNKYVIFKVNGTDYSSRTDSNGIAYLNENFALGNYEIVTINPLVNENRTNNLLIFSSINAEDMIRAYNSGIDFKATFLDENAKALSDTPILFKINGEDKVVITNSKGEAILNMQLDVGTYTVISINTITDENKTNQLIISPSIQSMDMIRAYNSSMDYQAVFLDSDANKLINMEIIFEINSIQYPVITDNEGKAVLNIALPVGKYNITAINPFTGERSKRSLTIIERIVGNQDMLIGYGSNSYYRVRIVDNDGSFVGKDEIVTFKLNNIQHIIKTDMNGYAALKITENIGSYQIIAQYKGFEVSNIITVIQSIDSILTIDVNNTDYNQKVVIDVHTSPDYLEGNVTIIITNENGYYSEFSQKASEIITKELSGLNVSTYTVHVEYSDYDNYHVSEVVKTFKVLKINPNIIVTTEDGEYGGNATVTVNIPQVEGDVTVKIGNKVIITEFLVKDGVIIKKFSDLPVGEYHVSVTFNGNDNFNQYTKYAKLNISKSYSSFNVIAQNVEYGSLVKVLISSDLDGQATIRIENELKTVNVVSNHETELIFSDLPIGEHEIHSKFVPLNNNYYEQTDISYVEVTKVENIDVVIPSVIENEDNIISFNLPSDATGNVTIIINNHEYSTEVINGVVTIDLSELINGDYEYIVEYSGDDKYSSFTDYGLISISSQYSTIKSHNITINYGNEYDFKANFFNNDGSPLANAYVVFKVNDDKYVVKTDLNGLAVLKIGLIPGNYTITSINTKTDETKINILKIKAVEPQPIDEKDISVPSLDNHSSDGTVQVKLPSDATGTVTLKINGKNYEFNVVNGVANVKVPELANGGYSYTIIYSGDGKYSSFSKNGSVIINKQTTPAKPATKITLALKKVKVKKSAKKLIIKATLKVNGKAVKCKVIKFKFNKKSYKAKTNAKGVAKITVKKAFLKKLKAGKKVKYQATYGKITKKVTVKVQK